MTVAELIEQLNKFEPDTLVMWHTGEQIHEVRSEYGVAMLAQLPKLSKSKTNELA